MSVDSSEHDALGQHGLYAGKAPNGRRNHLSPSDRQRHLHVTHPLHQQPSKHNGRLHLAPSAGRVTLPPLPPRALAGTTVDTSLFPLDTLKTRLQSSTGFWASGGFRGIYNGIGSAVVGSAPGAALFFVTYEGVKKQFDEPGKASSAGAHMLAATLGEIAACAVRVPTEVVKQRAQAKQHPSSRAALASILAQRKSHGVARMWAELYRGWGVTVMREVPFTVIQFPLWEKMKSWSLERRLGKGVGKASDVTAAESAVFGSLSGGVAAALTTPLDVLKTRLMLATKRESAVSITRGIWREEGPKAFFSGLGPRTMWISIGGAVFLGSYQWASNMLGGFS